MESFDRKLNDPEKTSRRDFMKKLGLVGVGVLAGKALIETFSSDSEKEEESVLAEPPEIETSLLEEEFISHTIESCKLLIEAGNCREFLTNPYLVSALYYSDDAILTMVNKEKKNPQEKIISEIYTLINPKLRETYIQTLDEMYNEVEKQEPPSVIHDNQVPDTLRFSQRLDSNHLDAIDLFGKEGIDIHSFSKGLIILAEDGWKEGDLLSTSSVRGGNTVIMYDATKKEFYRYAHLEHVSKKIGKFVHKGEKIGVLGHTGLNASKTGHGEHIHFEINTYNTATEEMVALSAYELRDRIAGNSSIPMEVRPFGK